MKSLRILNRQVGLFAAAGALLLAVIVPTIAAAAQLTERSIALSSSSKAATGVDYEIKFKTGSVAAAGAIIDFCEETPIIGQECSTPTGFTTEFATGTGVDSFDENTLAVTQALSTNAVNTIAVGGITNPSVTGPFYARIVTYDTTGNLATYVDADTLGSGVLDEGGASIIVTDTIGVSGAVLESMTFCVSGDDVIANDCTGPLTAPTVKLGTQTGDVFALAPNSTNEGSIYTQITTNSASGAVVSLKSNAIGCGGLVRAGAVNCDISPAMDTDVTIADASAKFGVKAATSTGGSGFFQPVASSIYATDAFKMNWVLNDQTGVTSTFGDPFLDTNGAPATNKNMTLTFGASVTNATPAGLYSADLSLIATGKF